MAQTTSGVTPGASAATALTSVQKIAIAKALYTNEATRMMPKLVDHYPLKQGEYQENIPRFDRVSAAAATEGVDAASPTTIALNSVNVITGEHVAMVNITRKLRRQMSESTANVAGKLLGDALSRLRETDLLGLFDGFSKTNPGAGNPLGVHLLRQAVAYLTTENSTSYGAAPLPLNAVLHPEQISDIVEDLSVTAQTGTATYGAGSTYLGDMTSDVIHNHLVGGDKVYGITVWRHPLITRDSSDDAKGAVFAKGALALVESMTPDTWVDTDGSFRADEYGIVGDWRQAELVDGWGYEIYSDAAAA